LVSGRILKYLKENYADRCHIIYYKKAFWDTEIPIPNGGGRNLVEFAYVPDDFSTVKAIEPDLIDIADTVYLADSLNTKGSVDLDSSEMRASLVAFRDAFLEANPKVELKSMVNQVYSVYDSL
jgi:hypothetical protein